MKFIILVEEGGYQVRYWDEINNVIGECIAEAWDYKELYKTLQTKGFNIKKKRIRRSNKNY